MEDKEYYLEVYSEKIFNVYLLREKNKECRIFTEDVLKRYATLNNVPFCSRNHKTKNLSL